MIKQLPPPKPGSKISVYQSHQIERTTGRKKRPVPRFRVDYISSTDKRIRRTIGTEEQANAAKAKLELEAFGTAYLGQEERRPSISFAELRDLQLRRGLGKDSIAHDRSRWPTILEFFTPDRQASTTKPGDVDAFREWFLARPTPPKKPRESKHAATRAARRRERASISSSSSTDRSATSKSVRYPSRATCNRYLALLRTAFNLAIEDKLITENPIRRTHFFKEKPRDRIASPEELRTLLSEADPETRLAIVLAFETGLRESSIASIQRSWVDLSRREIRIPDTKNDDPIVVALSDAALEATRARMDSHAGEALFTVTANTIGKRFAALVKKQAIKDLKFHDLRHSAATRFARAGVDSKTIMRIGGWRSISSMLRYRHVDTTDLHAAIRLTERANAPRA